jgi:squalene-associated FAD-dependent desaturase
MAKHVVIVGAGLSGLAAAVHLASRGIRVTVLEQKPAPGGRAYSFRDKITGDTIDNGQHVLIAGYDRTMQFLDTIGTKELLRIQPHPVLRFHHPVRGFCEFRLSHLPVPFHLLAGIFTTSLLSVADRFRFLRAGASLLDHSSGAASRYSRLTIKEWLLSLHQSPELTRSLWEPLAVSIMNESIDRASAGVFIAALQKAFLGQAKNAAMAIPTVGLSQLYVDQAVKYILVRGGAIRCNAIVTRCVADPENTIDVHLRDNDPITGDAVICTVPPQDLPGLLPPVLAASSAPLAAISSAPIVSIHLWFDREFMSHDSVGLIGRRVQWLFNRRRLSTEKGDGAHVSAVISGAHEYVEKTKDQLVALSLEDIQSAYPHVGLQPRHSVVIREKNATYSSSPSVELLRPTPVTGVRNFFLAGDWTATGYPATIEGAVLSGETAAAYALEWLARL